MKLTARQAILVANAALASVVDMMGEFPDLEPGDELDDGEKASEDYSRGWMRCKRELVDCFQKALQLNELKNLDPDCRLN